MTDERTEVRAVLEAVSADPPPTRLSVEAICATARRSAGRGRLRPGRLGWRWWPTWPGSLRLRWHPPRPSRRLLSQLAALAVLAAVPALIVLAAHSDRTTSSTSSGGGAAALPDSGPIPYQLAGVVAVSADGLTLSATTTSDACHGPVVLQATEEPTAVSLRAAAGPIAPSGQAASPPACPAVGVTPLTVRLARPLGPREVLDAATGVQLTVVDGAKLGRVTSLPSGYRADGGCRLPSDPVAVADAVGHGRPPATEAWCVSLYRSSGGVRLSVAQVFGPQPPDGPGVVWNATAAARVHGLPAQVRTGSWRGSDAGQVWYVRQLRWSEHGVSVTVTSAAIHPEELLPAAELLRIAAGVRW